MGDPLVIPIHATLKAALSAAPHVGEFIIPGRGRSLTEMKACRVPLGRFSSDSALTVTPFMAGERTLVWLWLRLGATNSKSLRYWDTSLFKWWLITPKEASQGYHGEVGKCRKWQT
jgi:hypothetical protein